MKIYIDFDGTLFDTDKYNQDFINLFNKYGITNETFINERDAIFNKDNLFDLYKLAEHLIKKYNLNKEIKSKILNILNTSYIYPEIFECLNILNNKKYKLYILTYGNIKFQETKINCSNISKYFKEILITEKDKSKLNIDYEKSIFIDNNPEEIIKFKKAGAKKIIRIKRKSDKYSKKNCNIDGIHECKDFNEIIKLMEGGFDNE